MEQKMARAAACQRHFPPGDWWHNSRATPRNRVTQVFLCNISSRCNTDEYFLMFAPVEILPCEFPFENVNLNISTNCKVIFWQHRGQTVSAKFLPSTSQIKIKFPFRGPSEIHSKHRSSSIVNILQQFETPKVISTSDYSSYVFPRSWNFGFFFERIRPKKERCAFFTSNIVINSFFR